MTSVHQSASTVRHTIRAIGADVPVVLEDPAETFVATFEHVWHECLVGPPVGPRGPGMPAAVVAEEVVVPRDELQDGDVTRRRRALMQLTQRITRSAIKAQAGRLLMLHAGALAHPETGASVVFVAPGGTGKTTLARVLGPRWRYVTDETVAITRDGHILPYPKPLSIRPEPVDGIRDGVKDEVAPGDLGLRPSDAAPWVAGVVSLRREEGEGRDPAPVRREPVDVLDALVTLAPETSSLGLLERPLHWLGDLLTGTGGLVRLRYSDAATLEPVVRDVLGRTR